MALSLASTHSFIASKTRSTYNVGSLIREIQEAVDLSTVEQQVFAVKSALSRAVLDHPGFLPKSFTKPCKEHYARRPLYIDPDGRFSVLAMVWDKGQGTPLHDHGGIWVVECLYSGRMKVTNFECEGQSDGIHQFRAGETSHAVPGDADYRIPPHEYHILENDQDTPSVTIHVFGGLMEECDVFHEVEGGYVGSHKVLSYS